MEEEDSGITSELAEEVRALFGAHGVADFRARFKKLDRSGT